MKIDFGFRYRMKPLSTVPKRTVFLETRNSRWVSALQLISTNWSLVTGYGLPISEFWLPVSDFPFDINNTLLHPKTQECQHKWYKATHL